MNSLIQFKGTASFSRSVDCENPERFIFKAVCGPVFAVSARSRRGRPRRPIADRLDNLLDCVNHQLRFLTLNIVPAFCRDYVFGIWRKCRQRINMGNNAKIERIGEPMAFENQVTAYQDWDHITQPLPSAFLIDRSFRPERRDQPDNGKQNPAVADDIESKRIGGHN